MSELVDTLLWQLGAAGVRTPETELVFAPPRRFRFDLAWPDWQIACEVDGGSWVGGRHTSGAGFEKDCEKMNEAVIRGWRILRCTGNQVETGQCLGWVERALMGSL